MSFRQVRGLAMIIFVLLVVVVIDQSPGAAATDPGAGKDVFAKRCSGCHATDISKEGPRLRGVVGRKAGIVPGFQYSDALRDSGITWTEDLLAKWLENPGALVKGNDMEFRVANADERAAVIVYLKSLAN